MKTRLLILVSAILVTVSTSAQQQNLKAAEEEIIALEKAFAAAIKERDSLKAQSFQLNSYFLAVGIQGMPIHVVQRNRWLENLKFYVTESFSIDDIKVNIYGTTAVALMMYSQKAKVRGNDRSAQFVITDIWVREGEGWKIAERHSSRPEVPDSSRPK